MIIEHTEACSWRKSTKGTTSTLKDGIKTEINQVILIFRHYFSIAAVIHLVKRLEDPPSGANLVCFKRTIIVPVLGSAQ
jgi:hypothetical protein